MLLHASHNIAIQAIFTPLTGATAFTPYVIDEFGLGLALAGNVFAQDTQQSNKPQTQAPSTQNQPGAGDAKGKEGSAGSQRDRDYQAEVKKCDNATDKQKCLDAAKKSQGNM